MAKVQLVGPRAGLEFLGEAALPVTYAWVDEAGIPLPGDMPVISSGLGVTQVILRAQFTNDNDEAKTFSNIIPVFGPLVTQVLIAPVTIPAHSTVTVDVDVRLNGTQGHKDVTYVELTGESDA